MGSITSAGVGSGIDIESLVQKLVAAEGQGTRTRLDTREAQLQARLSAYGVFRNAIATLRTALAPLKDLAKFQGRTTTLSSKDYLGAAATSASPTGSHAIEVVRLAQAHKLASGPYATSDTVVGEGTLTLTVGGTSTLITIDSSNHTLAGIRDAINAASDNPGVSASLVTANDGVRLVLSSRDTGAASAITVTQSGTLGALVYDPGGGTTNLTQLQAAQDARVIADGFTYDSASNTVTGMLEGVTLTLLKANVPGETTTLTVGEDRDAARKSVDEFVRAYNALVNGIRGLSAYNASTKSGGPLLGDSTLRGFNLGLRQELGIAAASAPEGFRLLAQVGITLKVDGTLEVNSSRLAAALDGGFDAVGSLFAATDGVATRLDALLQRYVQSDGAIQARTDGLSASIKDITRQREALDRRLQLVEDRLRRQFNAMDTLVAQLRNTSSFLAQQLASLQPTGK